MSKFHRDTQKSGGLYYHTVAAMTCRVQENPRETADRIRWLTNFRKPRLWVSLAAVILVLALAALCLSGHELTDAALPAAGPGADAPQITPLEPYTGQIGFLMVGVDGSAENAGPDAGVASMADLIAYVSRDCDTGEVEVLQIPARLYMGASYPLADGTTYMTSNDTINSLPGANAAGVEALCRTVENMLMLPVSGYVRLDFDGLAQIVDYVGGIEINIPRELAYGGSVLPAGTHTLSGSAVEFFMRNRRGEGYDNGEIDRMEMQRGFYAGVLRYVQTCTPTDAVKLISVLAQHMQTTFDAETLTRLLTSMETVKSENVVFSQLPVYPGETSPNNVSCVVADPEATAALLNENFRREKQLAPDALHLTALSAAGDLFPGKSEALSGL